MQKCRFIRKKNAAFATEVLGVKIHAKMPFYQKKA